MSVVLTRLLELRAKTDADKYVPLTGPTGALDFIIEETKAPTCPVPKEKLAEIFASIGRNVTIPYFSENANISIANVRSAVIGDAENTTGLYAVQFVTLSTGFTVVPSLFSNNEKSVQQDFEKKALKAGALIAEAIDAQVVAALIAGTTTDFEDTLGYTLNGNKVAIPAANREIALTDLEVIMNANGFKEPFSIIGNAGVMSMAKYLEQYKVYNSRDTSNQLAKKPLYFTNGIVNEAGDFGNGIIVKNGSMALATRVERESLMGVKAGTGHEWGVGQIPGLNIPVGTYYYESVGDFSAIAGAASADMTRALKQHYGFAVDVAIISPLGLTNRQPIGSFALRA